MSTKDAGWIEEHMSERGGRWLGSGSLDRKRHGLIFGRQRDGEGAMLAGVSGVSQKASGVLR